MAMKSGCLVALACAPLLVSAAPNKGGWATLGEGWRLSAGGVYASPVKANFTFSPMRSVPRVGTTAAKAKDQAEGAIRQFTPESPNADVTFPNGARINPWDQARALNEYYNPGVSYFGDTWNAWFPAGSYKDGHFAVASYEYGEIVGYSESDYSSSDDSPMFGLNIELSHNIYHSAERHWGVDLAFGVTYFFNTDIYNAHGQVASGQYNSGTYNTVINQTVDVTDPWGFNADGSYGNGTFAGPGPVFNLNNMGVTHSGSSQSLAGYVNASGDYWQLDFMLLAKPYYDLFDWLRIVGSIGPVLSRGQFDLDTTLMNWSGSTGRSSGKSEWNFHGIAGLGLVLSYQDWKLRDWSLGVDFYARFFQKDLTINDDYVHGDIEQSRWLLKVSLGYAF